MSLATRLKLNPTQQAAFTELGNNELEETQTNFLFHMPQLTGQGVHCAVDKNGLYTVYSMDMQINFDFFKPFK